MAEYIEIASRLGKGKYDYNSITETAYPVMLINMDDPVFGGRLKINEILVNWWYVTRLNLCWIHYLLLPAVLQRIQWALLVSKPNSSGIAIQRQTTSEYLLWTLQSCSILV